MKTEVADMAVYILGGMLAMLGVVFMLLCIYAGIAVIQQICSLVRF